MNVPASSSGRSRINRNIVECKDEDFLRKIIFLIVLIETLWNVKFKPVGI